MNQQALAAPSGAAAPLSEPALSAREAARLERLLAPLVEFIGTPGDWGWGSQVSHLALAAVAVRDQIRSQRGVQS